MIYHVILIIIFWGFFFPSTVCDLNIIDPSCGSQKEGQYLQLFHHFWASANCSLGIFFGVPVFFSPSIMKILKALLFSAISAYE